MVVSHDLPVGKQHEQQGPASQASPLSRRESQIVALMEAGHSAKQIGFELGISAATARTLLTRAARKLGRDPHSMRLRPALLPRVDTTATVLGIEKLHGTPKTRLELIEDIERGLPVSALDRISSLLAPEDPNFRLAIVPRATLARRKKQPGSRLSPEESDRLARLAQVWSFAKSIWRSEESARAFLFRRHPILSERRPVDVALATDFGARLVEEILGRLEYGSAA